MKFRDIALAARATVSVPGGEKAVRGLNLMDILGLVERHRPALGTAFNELSGDTDKILASPGAIGSGLLAALPAVAAEVILLADADDGPGMGGEDTEADTVEDVRRLPASVQLALLEKIAELTFIAEGGAGKVVEIVISAVGGTASLVKQLGPRT